MAARYVPNLQGLSGVQCVLDDMIFTGKNDDEHLKNLENVLQRLQDNIGLRANIEKCSCLQDSVVYCGHEINKERLQKTKESRSCCKYSSAKEHYTATTSVRVSELLSQVFAQSCY